MINRIADKGNGSVILGTHNVNSVVKSLELWGERGFACGGGIGYAQLCGMSDNLSFPLAAAGYPVFKYLPFGPVAETIPFLLRRAQENSGSCERSQNEANSISLEILRRVRAVFH